MPPLTLNFEVASLPDGRYRINLKSPVGEAQAEASAPFTPAELENYRALFARRTDGLTRAQEANAARQFGTRLFDFLIRTHDQVNAAYFASLAQAGSSGLLIRLSVEGAGELASLPWELIRDPNRDFLSLSRQTPLVRYTQQLNTRTQTPIQLPLRVLVMISSPSGYPTLDVEGEWARLQEATAELQKRGMLVLERLDHATLIALQRKLRAREYHIFHYIGHSVFDTLAGQGLLAFETEQDQQRAQLVSAGSLSREIGEESSIRLVLLNSCESAQRDQDDVFAGIASALVARGVPAVVAMQHEITDPAAKAFAEEFYRALAEGLPVEAAVSEGRRAIANRVQNIEWATPVLFMRSDNGNLFGINPPTATRPVMSRVEIAARQATPAQPEPKRPFPWIAAAFGLAAVGFVIGLLIAGFSRTTPTTPTATPLPTIDPALLPDLAITNARNVPLRPAPGQIFRLSISITNQGQTPSGNFIYSWDASALQGDAQVAELESLPSGASRNFTITFAYGWWGIYDSVVRADTLNDVDELDDQTNNRRTQTIEINPTAPFVIDYLLLPTLELSEPGMLLPNDLFVDWNMVIGVDARERMQDCGATPLVFVDAGTGDIAVQAQAQAGNASVDESCTQLPISIEMPNRRVDPASNATAEIIPVAGGEGTIILYRDEAGQQEVFRASAPLIPGEPVVLGDPAARLTGGIRRIDIMTTPGQAFQLTTLTLFPPG
jgi:CHAT domain-containing protein